MAGAYQEGNQTVFGSQGKNRRTSNFLLKDLPSHFSHFIFVNKLKSILAFSFQENLEFPLTGAHLIGELPDTDAGIELEDEENSSAGLIYLPPQNMSSRASQMSSLLHSHSGSIEMNETSLISSRARSFEQELRGYFIFHYLHA